MFNIIKRKRKVGYRGIKRWGRYEEDYAIFPQVINYEQRVNADGGVTENIYCLHMKLGLLSLPDPCDPKGGELLYNTNFYCGLSGWHFDPNYTAELTDNGNGSIHLKATSNYGSVVPDNQNYPNDTYILKIEVANVQGNGKMSIRNTANTWFNLLYFTTPGTYSVEYTGSIKDIHCGASNDTDFECDFLSYSLKIKA